MKKMHESIASQLAALRTRIETQLRALVRKHGAASEPADGEKHGAVHEFSFLELKAPTTPVVNTDDADQVSIHLIRVGSDGSITFSGCIEDDGGEVADIDNDPADNYDTDALNHILTEFENQV